MKTTRICLFLLAACFIAIAISCEEDNIHGRKIGGTEAPLQISDVTYKPLFGGARFFYTAPSCEDLLYIMATYTNDKGKSFSFSASYFVDSLDVIGFGDTIDYRVDLYAVNRAGVKSTPVTMMVKPLESAISRVAQSIEVKPGFGSFFLDWKNELEQSVNVYVDFSYTRSGVKRDHTAVFSSNLPEDRRFVENLLLTQEEPVSVKVRVADIYDNVTDPMDMGELILLEDIMIPKDNWFLPAANDSIGGVPQGFGDGLEGRLRYLIDGIIDKGDNLNFMHTHSRGRTGNVADGNMPWNVIIDLGDYYELSRIITHQRHSGGLANIHRGQYYRHENVGIYAMYYWNEILDEWVHISEHTIPVPVGLSELEFVKAGEAGDMAYMYPDDPQYTPPTRWFRYEALKGFTANYTREDANCLSEITLYGRKANR